MKKIKIVSAVIAGLLAIFLCVLIIHHFTHPIKIDSSDHLNPEDRTALAEEISRYGLKQGASPRNVELYSWAKVGDTVYYLMEVDGRLGYARLTEGLNGGYKLHSISHGTGIFLEGIIPHKETKYLLMAGRNNEPRIAKITAASTDGIVYEFLINDDEDYYFICVELDPQPQNSELDRGSVTFYDCDGNDITGSYDRSGGAFHAPWS